MKPITGPDDTSKAQTAPGQEKPQVPDTGLDRGLTEEVARDRLAAHGPNALSEEKIGPLRRLLR